MSKKIIIINKNGSQSYLKLFSELYIYRYFLIQLVKRNFISIYKQTILGPLWAVINPIIATGAFTIVFSKIAKLPTEGVHPFLFYYAGVTIWSFFQASVIKNSEIFISHSILFRNAYFPRIIIPISNLLDSIYIFCIQFIIFLALIAYFSIVNNFDIKINFLSFVYTFLIIVYLTLLSFSYGLIVSCLTAKYRDLRILSTFWLQLIFYASPVIYSTSLIPKHYDILFLLNPLVYPLELFKALFLSTPLPDIKFLVSGLIISFIMFFISIIFFIYIEKKFDDFA